MRTTPALATRTRSTTPLALACGAPMKAGVRVDALPPDASDAPEPDAGPAGVTAAEAAEGDDVPAELVAVTVNVCATPLASPVMVQVVAPVVVHVPFGEPVTVYPVIVAPPSLAGADHDTVAEPSPATAVGWPGAPGAAAVGVTAAVAAEAAPTPALDVAVTVKVYGVPTVRPVIVQAVALVVVHVPPGEPVTVYPVTERPSLLAGTDHDTVASRSPAVADGKSGALGALTPDSAARRLRVTPPMAVKDPPT